VERGVELPEADKEPTEVDIIDMEDVVAVKVDNIEVVIADDEPVDETEEVLVMSVGSGNNDNEADDVVVDVAVERDGERNLAVSDVMDEDSWRGGAAGGRDGAMVGRG